jgi:hypothetical protein
MATATAVATATCMATAAATATYMATAPAAATTAVATTTAATAPAASHRHRRRPAVYERYCAIGAESAFEVGYACCLSRTPEHRCHKQAAHQGRAC